MSDGDPIANRPSRSRLMPDRCEICGQFVGWYPIGFHCDRHCAKCVCSDCGPATIAAARARGQKVAY